MNWQDSANWSASPFPGATSGYTSTEVASFAAAGGGAINLGGTLNVARIVFGTGAAGFTIGDADDVLRLTAGGGIDIGGGVFTNQTIGVPAGFLGLSASGNNTVSFTNNGQANLTIASTLASSQTTGNLTRLVLGGYGDSQYSGNLSVTGTAGTSGLGLTKQGSGTWTLAGSSTYTSTTRVLGGKLVLDYATNDPISSATQIYVSNGALEFKGKSSGTTSDTVSWLALGGGFGTVSYNTGNTLSLNANGGAGVNLTVGTLQFNDVAVNSNLFDLSSSAGNSLTINALDSASARVVNGVLMAGSSASPRASNIVRDSTGYGFATLSGTTNGTVSRLTSGTSLDATNTGNTTNFFLTGNVTRSAALDFSTITIDATTGPITLAMGANNLTPTAFGRGILVTGSNDVSITGTGQLGNASVFVYNYGTGDLSISLSTASDAAVAIGGTGFTNFSGIIGSTGTGFLISQGIVRFSRAQELPTTGNYYITDGGVLEIGADLSANSTADLTRSVTAAAAGNTGLHFRGDSGISASGADRVVNFGNATTPTTLTWGSNGFLVNTDETDGGYTFLLSSRKSDAKLTLLNGIALGNGTTRTIDVANGSAATDAVLAGVLSGNGALLVKKGNGTLELSATNTYSGGTVVTAGTLLVTGSLANGAVNVVAGAKLGGNGTIGGATTVSGTLAPGNSPGVLTFSSSLTLESTAATVMEINGTARGTEYDGINLGSGELTYGGSLTLNIGTTFGEGNYTFDLFNIGSGGQTGDFASVALAGNYSGNFAFGGGVWSYASGNATWTFDQATGDLALSVVPEPHVWALLALSGTALMIVRRRRA